MSHILTLFSTPLNNIYNIYGKSIIMLNSLPSLDINKCYGLVDISYKKYDSFHYLEKQYNPLIRTYFPENPYGKLLQFNTINSMKKIINEFSHINGFIHYNNMNKKLKINNIHFATGKHGLFLSIISNINNDGVIFVSYLNMDMMKIEKTEQLVSTDSKLISNQILRYLSYHD